MSIQKEYTINYVKQVATEVSVRNSNSYNALYMVKNSSGEIIDLSYLKANDCTLVTLVNQEEYSVESYKCNYEDIPLYGKEYTLEDITLNTKIYRLDTSRRKFPVDTILALATKSLDEEPSYVSLYGIKAGYRVHNHIAEADIVNSISSTTRILKAPTSDEIRVYLKNIGEYNELYLTTYGKVEVGYEYKQM